MDSCIKKYKDYGNALFVSNKVIELVVLIDRGLRIIKYNLIGQQNVFHEFSTAAVDITKDFSWRPLGGHRLWHSPESIPRSYTADDMPVQYKIEGNTITVTQPADDLGGLSKEIKLTLTENSSEVHVTHKLTNCLPWPLTFGAWALSVMDGGGIAILPFTAEDTGCLHNRQISVWPYTDLSDNRFIAEKDYLFIKQDGKAQRPFKIGYNNQKGWAAYLNDKSLFIKRYVHDRNVQYPDNNVSFEIYTDNKMVEIETLSSLSTVEPNSFILHDETWLLEEVAEGLPDSASSMALINLLKCYIEI